MFGEICFYVWLVSAAVIVFFMAVLAPLAVKYYAKQFKEEGMVKIPKKTNWAAFWMALLRLVFWAFCPVLNTIIALVWVLASEKVLETWKNETMACFCYPDELP